jgi:hypothetical protein
LELAGERQLDILSAANFLAGEYHPLRFDALRLKDALKILAKEFRDLKGGRFLLVDVVKKSPSRKGFKAGHYEYPNGHA